MIDKLKEYFDMKTFMVMMVVFTVIFLVSGSSLALWRWTSSNSQKTNITFKANSAFSCSANGGGDITSSNIQLQPAKCTDTEHAIKRQISYRSTINNSDLAVDYKLYLDINDIGTGLLDSRNFRYAVTTTNSSCDSDIISSGKITNEQITLFEKPFLDSSNVGSVYLWIWLDDVEEDAATMNQSFSASLSGTCEVNENINKDKLLVKSSDFRSRVYTNLGTAYQTKTGLTDFNPETLTFYANGHLPEGISLEELNTYANVDVSYKQNGKIKAYYNNNNVYIYSNNQIYANVDSSYMFWDSRLLALNLSELDTSNVTNMMYMFRESQVANLNLSGFNTSNVTNMSFMFFGSQTITLDLSSFDTSKVTNMRGMFEDSHVTELDLSSFDTSNVTDMSSMFMGYQDKILDLSGFNTSKVTDMMYMFRDSQVTNLNLGSFDTSNVTNMWGMFYYNYATTIDLSSFDTSRVINMSSMFKGSQVTTLDLSSFDTSNVTNMSSMFYFSKASTLDLSSFDTSKVTNMSEMFTGYNASTLDLSHFNTSKVKYMNSMFSHSSVPMLDLSSFNTSQVTDMSGMFSYSKATTIDLSHFDTSNVINMSQMFYSSPATTINLSSFDLGNYTGNYSNMFNYNSKLTNLIVKDQASKDFILNNFSSSYINDSKISIYG